MTKPTKTLIAITVLGIFSANASIAAVDALYADKPNLDMKGDNISITQNKDTSDPYRYFFKASQNNLRIYNIGSVDIHSTDVHDLSSMGTIYAENNHTMDITSENSFSIIAEGYGQIIHANGGKINLNAGKDITLTNYTGNVAMVQPQANQEAQLSLITEGNINIHSVDDAGVMVASLSDEHAASCTIQGRNVTLTSDTYIPLVMYDKDVGGWGPDIGKLSINVHADENLTLNGANGFYSTRTVDAESEAILSADKNISIHGTATAVYISAKNSSKSSTSIVAPSVEISSDTGTAVNIIDSRLYFGYDDDSKKRSQITLSAPQNSAAILATADSNIAIENSDLNIKSGNVSSEGILNLKNSRLSLAADSTQFYVDTLTGEESQIIVNGTATQLTVGNNSLNNLQVLASGSYSDQFATAEAAYAALNAKTTISGAQLGGEAGTVADAWTVKDEKIEVTRNASLEAFSQFNAMTLTQWRAENNHLSKRLGDVRSTRGEIGSWARIYGYDSRLKDSVDTEVKATSIQVGSDVSVGKNWIIGGAFTYTDMSGDFDNGSSDADSYSLSAYATGLFECGGFIDVIGRVGRISTDISASTLSADGGVLAGSYDNTALALSVETGYHWTPASIFYVEPQAELSYSYVLGDSFTSSANGVSIDQDDFQSLVGRFGAQIGASLPQNAGRIYVEASVNHDFLGDADATATPAKGVARRLSSDLGSTWYSYGIGLQLNLTDRTSFYGSLDRANGNDYQEDYRYSVGLRHIW